MIPSFFEIEIFAIHDKYSGSVTNGLNNIWLDSVITLFLQRSDYLSDYNTNIVVININKNYVCMYLYIIGISEKNITFLGHELNIFS